MLINTTNSIIIRNYELDAPTSGLPFIYDPTNNYWSITEGLGLLPVH